MSDQFNSLNHPLPGLTGNIKIYNTDMTHTIACLPAMLCKIDEQVDLLPLWTTASAPFADILPSKCQPPIISFRLYYRSVFNPFTMTTKMSKGSVVAVEFDTHNGSYSMPLAYVGSLTTTADADGMTILDITLLGAWVYSDPGGNVNPW